MKRGRNIIELRPCVLIFSFMINRQYMIILKKNSQENIERERGTGDEHEKLQRNEP